ncbi:MAG: MlaD family protein [Candidatus Omnitrophica bacterium]|nr:MlaD family protein [Candidatus Omnitrophota bacterium]
MIFGKSKLELKVGIFVFIGLAILIFFVLSIGNFKIILQSHRIDFLFNFTNGVKVGAPVRFAGVDIGEVKGLYFVSPSPDKPPKVRIIGWVRRDINIPADSAVWINTLGLLGEKYIEIMPGRDYAHIVKANDVLTGVDPIPMQEFTTLAKKIGTGIDSAITGIRDKEGTVGKLLYDDTIYNELEALISDLRRNPWKIFWKTREKPPKSK